MKLYTSQLLAGIIALAFFSFSFQVYAGARTIVFPVNGKYNFRDDFSEPRDGGTRTHLGIDIIADKMTPVVAATDGVITFIAIPQASWGYSISIRDSEGFSYRYLHLNNDTPGTDDGQGGEANAYAPGLKRRTTVTKGQLIGWVGDSGNAEATISHLHFEIWDPSRTAINPYESLLAASGGKTSSGQSGGSVIMHSNEGGLEEEEQVLITRSLQEGMIDPDILTLHEQLKALGYYAGAIAETYNSVTREAVRQFQNENKLPPTGIADVLTRKAVAASFRLLPTLPVSNTTSATSELSQGSEGEAVRVLQQKLKELGFFSAGVTGYFGPITHASVVAFQNAKGIDPIGIVGPRTRAALDAASSPVAGPFFVFTKFLEQGMRGNDVQELQLLLKREGYFNDEPTGYFGAITRASVIAFQNANDIEPLGIVGPKTRAALNTLQ
ncbi:MAG: peptidoglycan-binding protein [Patescibacteria group bacterium]|nr:peptidoglycan-binding protein [bacterium]MDZ4241165.1 peptidoglycan-binding protein [Patescibacteria group bacterium]